ncbi:RNA polymerase subunit sigma-24 [Clostridium beijerinckii]|uniref:RNA polymerase subunit sigma-24 n=1 Tax=Clostridium beijerinckii TaxID=1520 RepID=A0A0B5QRC6_CLOBE|nr:RNA polymerase sigma factor [Clostridium beijerinckii]AJH00812.1 RNA polymerase subunit sigma-24 [Clostridium beijerinckii]
MEEQEFVEKMKTKDENAFIYMVDVYKKRILSLCYSYTSDYYEAEDLSQEVFISVFNNIDKFREESSFSTYLYKITTSKCIDYTRKRSIKNFLTGLFIFSKESTHDIDEQNFIRQSIQSLPLNLKTPLVLYYYIGLTQKEIADILNLPLKTIEGRIYRSKNKLKNIIETEVPFYAEQKR